MSKKVPSTPKVVTVTPAIFLASKADNTFLQPVHILVQISLTSHILYDGKQGSGFVWFGNDSDARIFPELLIAITLTLVAPQSKTTTISFTISCHGRIQEERRSTGKNENEDIQTNHNDCENTDKAETGF